MTLTFEDVQKAYEKIESATMRTPCVKAARLSLHMGIEIYLLRIWRPAHVRVPPVSWSGAARSLFRFQNRGSGRLVASYNP